MKIPTLLLSIAICLCLCIFTTNCKKENQAPSCNIIAPTDLSQFSRGETVSITVQADDPDGEITEIVISINGSDDYSLTSEPYTYSWLTGDAEIGNNNITAKAIDNENGQQTDEITIEIVALIPSLTTKPVISIMDDGASGGGDIISNGGEAITARGICWSLVPDPTTADNITTDGLDGESFVSSLAGLTTNTTYYVRAYAMNSIGTGYGNSVAFSSIAPGTISDVEGNVYNTITIGTQVWMAENLKSSLLPDQSSIPLVETNSAWDNLGPTDKAYCYYNNSSTNGDIYGSLYTWEAAMNGSPGSDNNPSGVRGVCPDGWHLPSISEWTELTDYFAIGMNVCGKLKEVGTTHWTSPNTGATNESGFSALPGGYRSRGGGGYFLDLGTFACFWSTTLDDNNAVETVYLRNDSQNVIWSFYSYAAGLSVRCVKN